MCGVCLCVVVCVWCGGGGGWVCVGGAGGGGGGVWGGGAGGAVVRQIDGVYCVTTEWIDVD